MARKEKDETCSKLPNKIWKIVFNKNKKKEKRKPNRNRTSQEEDLKGKQTIQEGMKKGLQEEDITGIYPYMKLASQKDSHTKRQEEGLTGR